MIRPRITGGHSCCVTAFMLATKPAPPSPTGIDTSSASHGLADQARAMPDAPRRNPVPAIHLIDTCWRLAVANAPSMLPRLMAASIHPYQRSSSHTSAAMRGNETL